MSLPMTWTMRASAVFRPVRERVLRLAGLLRPLLGRRDVADRRVEPDVEELVRLARNRKAEVRPVAADVPVGEALLKNCCSWAASPRFMKLGLRSAPSGIAHASAAGRRGAREFFQHRRRAADRRVRVDQLLRAVGRAADFSQASPYWSGDLQFGQVPLMKRSGKEAMVLLVSTPARRRAGRCSPASFSRP